MSNTYWDEKIKDIAIYDQYYRRDYEKDFVDFIKQVKQPYPVTDKEPEISKLTKLLARELKEAKALFDKLAAQKQFADNPLNFLYSVNDNLNEMQNWCFENDLVFKLVTIDILEDEVQAIVFKTEEDAMAFKLRWAD